MSDALQKIAVIFSSEYEGAIDNLTEKYSKSLKEIFTWDLKKIKFLCSDKVIDVINRFNYDVENIFSTIVDMYDRNDKFTCDFVNKIYNGEKAVEDVDFEDL